MQRKFPRCRKVQKSCNEHRDLFKNASLTLYTIYNDVMSMKVQKVKVVHRVSKFTIPSTDPVKINRRAFVSCSRVKACNFPGFVNISSETFLAKLSPLNELRNYGDR